MDLTLLVQNPLLTLTVVIALGFLIGRLKIGSFSLGVAAVLFAGIGVSAIDPHVALPTIVYEFGLALFVYTVGLAAGPGFFSALKKTGLRYNIFAAAVLALAAAEAFGLAKLFKLNPEIASGMYAGAVTNTPALAAVLEGVKHLVSGPGAAAAAAAPVVGYSLAYPIGVLGVLTAIFLTQKLWRVDNEKEALESGLLTEAIEAWSVRVKRTDIPRVMLLQEESGAEVLVSRLQTTDDLRVALGDDKLHHGDLVTLVGSKAELEKATKWLGERVAADLGAGPLAQWRMFVSNREIAGHTIRQLQLRSKYGFAITRIMREDVDMLAGLDMPIELGDQVLVVGSKSKMKAAAKLLGDSYKSLSEMDVLTFAVGLSLGLLVGLIPIPLPGGSVLHLGPAGGALIVSLLLGWRGRTGRILWQVPHNVNLTLRQVGVVLFLAGIGSRAGGAFVKALSNPSSLTVVTVGMAITLTTALVALVVGYKFMKIPFAQTTGMLAALQTQPAVLAYTNEQAKNDLPNLGYTTIYPLAMVAKIVLAQVLLSALLR